MYLITHQSVSLQFGSLSCYVASGVKSISLSCYSFESCCCNFRVVILSRERPLTFILMNIFFADKRRKKLHPPFLASLEMLLVTLSVRDMCSKGNLQSQLI